MLGDAKLRRPVAHHLKSWWWGLTVLSWSLAIATNCRAQEALNGPAAIAQPELSTPCLQDIPGFFAQHALGLPPTQPSFSLGFPLLFVRRIVWDTGYMLTAPGRWERPDWTRFSLFAAGTGAALGLDREVDLDSRLHNRRSGAERDVDNAIQDIGDLPGIAGVIGGSYALGLLTGSDELTRMATDIGESLVISGGLFTGGLKEVIGRSRPNAGDGPFHFAPFSGNASMPSGHATAAFAMAAGVSEHFDNNLWVAVPAYGLATSVAVSRIRADAHFLSDVFVGGVIGALTARTVVHLEQQRLAGGPTHRGPDVTVAPMLGTDVRGVQIQLEF